MSFITEHENSEICLLGDFNARTSNLNDTLFIDENMSRTGYTQRI